MPSHKKSFGPNKRVAIGSRNNIFVKSWKEYQKTQAYMRPSKNINIGQPNAKIVNHSVAKGPSKANHVPTSKDMKEPTVSSFEKEKRLVSLEKQKALSRSIVNGKERHALERKGEVNDASLLNHSKAMPGMVPKTIDRLGQSSSLSSNREEDITGANYSTTKLEFSKGIMVPKDSCTIEGNDRQDGIAVHKEKVMEFGEYQGDTTKAKHTLDLILSSIHCNSGDNHSTNLTVENVEERGFIERNIGQFANCNNTSMSKKRKEPLFEENPVAPDGNNSKVGVQVDNLSCKQTKKLKQSRVTRKGEVEDGTGDLNHVGVEDDTATILKNDHAKVLVSSWVERQCYSCSKPIDKPNWSGIFKTDDKEYVSLDGHLSTKSCEKAWSLSRQLLRVVEVKKLSKLEVWPKAWEVSPPNGDDIGIYFFPHEMRQDESLDQLVREVMENDLALQAILGEAEMLIFPSILLPIHHQTFQRKHYLWGVFKRREDKGVVVEEPPLNAMGRCEMEKQQKVALDQPNHMLLVEPNQEMSRMADAVPLERDMLPPNKRTQEVEASRLKGPTNNKGFDLRALCEEGGQAEGAFVATNAASFPASQGQNSSMGHTPGGLIGFVVRKTPKLDRIIREIEREGALVFAMQGEMVGAGSWAGSKATAMQK